jgi:hypothetical protein
VNRRKEEEAKQRKSQSRAIYIIGIIIILIALR